MKRKPTIRFPSLLDGHTYSQRILDVEYPGALGTKELNGWAALRMRHYLPHWASLTLVSFGYRGRRIARGEGVSQSFVHTPLAPPRLRVEAHGFAVQKAEGPVALLIAVQKVLKPHKAKPIGAPPAATDIKAS